MQGLHYVSGRQSGLTNERGEFTYELSNGSARDVSFSVGSVAIGAATGKSIITPLDLADQVDGLVTEEAANIPRFLLLLDEDANSDNGILIPPDVQSLAAGWPAVDFSLGFEEFASSPAMTRIISDVASVTTGTAPVLPDPVFATAHLVNTLACIYAGVYVGTVSGDHDGVLTLAVLPSTQVFGFAGELGHLTLVEEPNMSFGGPGPRVQFSKTIPGTGTIMAGQFPSLDDVTGEWQNDTRGTQGRFTGRRVGGDFQANYRWVTAFDYSDGTFGITFDIDESGGLTGRGYDGHRRIYFNATGPAGTFTLRPDGQGSLATDVITYNPIPTDVHVIPLAIHSLCRLN